MNFGLIEIYAFSCNVNFTAASHGCGSRQLCQWHYSLLFLSVGSYFSLRKVRVLILFSWRASFIQRHLRCLHSISQHRELDHADNTFHFLELFPFWKIIFAKIPQPHYLLFSGFGFIIPKLTPVFRTYSMLNWLPPCYNHLSIT